MNAIGMSRPRITAVAATAAMTTLAVIGLTAANRASADAGRTLRLTSAIDSIVFVGGPPPAQAPGGTFFVYSHVVSGGEGTTSASCVLVSAFGTGVRQCEVDMVLTDDIVTMRGLTDLANTEVTLVVTGGTGRYASARGTGTLTPTRKRSEVELTLR